MNDGILGSERQIMKRAFLFIVLFALAGVARAQNVQPALSNLRIESIKPNGFGHLIATVVDPTAADPQVSYMLIAGLDGAIPVALKVASDGTLVTGADPGGQIQQCNSCIVVGGLAGGVTTAIKVGADGTVATSGGGGSGGGPFPQTVSGTVNSGGIPCFNSATNMESSAALTANYIVLGGGAGACVSASQALPNGTTATTQSQANASTKVATTAYVDTGLGGKAASTAATTVNGQTCTLSSTCAVESATSGQVAISGGSGAALTGAADLTYSSHTFSATANTIFDLSAPTGTANFKVPSQATNTASAAAVLDYDTTNSNYHAYNGADSIIGLFPTASVPTTGHLISATVSSSKVTLADAGAFPVSGQSQYSIPVAASAALLSSTVCTPPAANGLYPFEYTVTGGTSVAPDCSQVGIAARSINGATTTDTVGASTIKDSICIPITHDIAGSQAVTITIPTPTTLANTYSCVIYDNHSAQTDTLKATTWTMQANNTAAVAGSTGISIPPATKVTAIVDPFNATQWFVDTTSLSGGAFPLTVSGTVNSGGIPCFTSTTVEASSAALAAGVIPKGGGAGACVAASSMTDNGTTVTSTDTGGYVAPVFVSSGTTAGFVAFSQGSTSASLAPCNGANIKCYQAPAALTANLETLAPATAQGIFAVTGNAATTNEMYSGDSNHSLTVSFTASQTVGATSLCSTTYCPAGFYMVAMAIDITTACTTTGTIIPWVGYTDDTTVAKGSTGTTFFATGGGAGFVPATGTLTTTATTNYAQGSFMLYSTGAAAINYGYTSSACGSGSLAGKLRLTVIPLG